MKEEDGKQSLTQSTKQGVTTKKKYAAPHLLLYGSVAKLTQNGEGSGGDLGTMAGMMMVCL